MEGNDTSSEGPPPPEPLPEGFLSLEALFTWPARRMDLLMVCLWSFLTFYGWIVNMLMIWLIVRSKAMKALTCYWYIVASCAAEFLCLTNFFFDNVPLIIWRELYFDSCGELNPWLFVSYQIPFYSAVMLMMATAVNRLLCIAFPFLYEQFFTKQRTALTILVCFLLGLAAAVPNMLPCCKVYFFPADYVAFYGDQDTWFIKYDITLNSTACITSIICYSCIIFFMFKHRDQPTGSKKTELRLALQCAVTSCVYAVAFISWNILPYSSKETWAFAATTTTFFVNSCTSATIYLTSNSLIKREFKLLIGRSTDTTIVTVSGSNHHSPRGQASNNSPRTGPPLNGGNSPRAQ